MAFDPTKVDLSTLSEVSAGDELDDNLNFTISEAVKVNPDQHAKVLDLSKRSGVPAFAVQDNPEAVEQDLKKSQYDFTGLRDSHPTTANHFDDINKASVSHDDIDVLKGIEDTVKGISDEELKSIEIRQHMFEGKHGLIERALMGLSKGASSYMASKSMLGAVGAAEEFSEFSEERRKFIESGLHKDITIPGLGGVRSAPGSAISGRPGEPVDARGRPLVSHGRTPLALNQEAYDEALRRKDQLLEKAVATYGVFSSHAAEILSAPVSNAAMQAETFGDAWEIVKLDPIAFIVGTGAESAAFMVEPMVAGIVGAGLGGTPGFMVATGLGSAHVDYAAGLGEAMQRQGVDTTDSNAVKAALLDPRMLTTIKGEAELHAAFVGLFDGLSAGIASKTLAPQVFKKPLTREFVNMVNQFGVQAAAGMAGEASGQYASTGEVHSPGEVIAEGAGELITSPVDVATATAAGLRGSLEADLRKSKVEQNNIDQLNDKAPTSKLRGRDKGLFKQFVEKADGENNTHVFIDGAQTSLYLQDKTKEEIEADPALKLLAEQAREAAALGVDVQIPVADFAADIAGTDHYTALRESMTMSDSTTSPFRQEQAKQETDSFVRNLMAEAQESASEYVEAQDIYETVRSQLIDSGQVTPANASIMSQIVPAWVTAQARRHGKTVQQVYQDSGLSIEGPQTGEKARISGDMVLEQVAKPAAMAVDPAEAWAEHHAVQVEKEGLSPEQAVVVAPKPDTDPLTGLYTDTELLPALERAKVAGGSVYTESDTFNLGGMNKAMGANVRADAVLKQIAEAYAAAYPGMPVFRRAGGRFGAIVPKGFDTVAATAQVDEAVARIAEENDLTDIEAPKVAGAKGIGLYSGVSDVKQSNTIDEVIGSAQEQINAAMPQGASDVDRDKAFETWAATSAGQAGGIAARVAENSRQGRSGGTGRESTVGLEALERVGANPDSVVKEGNRAFSTPMQVRRQQFEETAQSVGLTVGKAEPFRPTTHRDPLTGWFTNRDLLPTIARAQQLVEDTGVEASYGVVDISNLGGMTLALGREVADIVFRNMAQIAGENAVKIPHGESTPFRHGGDEIAFVITGAGPDATQVALEQAAAEVSGYIEAIGLQDLPHAKDIDNEARKGSGIYIGVQRIGGTQMDITDIVDRADAQVELGKTQPRAAAVPVQVRGEGERFAQDAADYQGEHKAPGPDDAALYDVTKGGDIYPDDIYSSKGLQYYGTGQGNADRESMAVIQRVRGKPNAPVTMYRAVPEFNKELKDEQKTVNSLYNYYQKFNFFPTGDEYLEGIDDIFAAEFQKGSITYDEKQQKILQHLSDRSDELYDLTKGKTPINSGDWVTLSKSYAKEHGESALDGNYKIISKKVKAKELFTNGDSINEFGYWKEGEPFAQPVEQKDLFVAHNLSAENIIAAADLGGLAAPSLAVARSGVSDFTGFGEVTLLADPTLLEDPKARTFDADIYSPRQPRATYDIDGKAFSAFYRQLDPDNLGLSKPDINSLEESSGADNLLRSSAVEYYWMQSQGKAPKVKQKKVEPIIRTFAKVEGDLVEDPKFIKAVTDHYQKQLDAMTEQGYDVRAEKMTGWYFDENGIVRMDKLRDMDGEVRNHRRSGGKDVHQLRDDISKKMRVKKTRNEYEQWVTEQFNSMVKGKKIFKGFTPSGNRKYVDYNMQNVVKEMTQQLQAGESTFYGAGTVRSKYANEMKTIAQIQAKRDEIISEEDMQKVKDESSDVFMGALEALKPFYKFDADSWSYADDAGAAIIEGRKGLSEAFNMTPEAQQIVDDLLEYLTALPTSYFEAKIQRAVQFSEFNTAVVPKGMRKDALQVLKDAGLTIKTYDPAVKESRADVIAKQKQLLFQPTSTDAPGARGYYDPANSIIRLTEAANLSTFLHEFAHFMYEMEVKGDTDMLQSINGWYKRNAADVAKEANRSTLPRRLERFEELLSEETDVKIKPQIQSEIDAIKSIIKSGGVTAEELTIFLDEGTTGNRLRDKVLHHTVHEQFARGFEAYLMEGKAPSIELRNAFRTFARWLARIYQSMRGQLNVNLDAEMRAVFDRLLATEEQIAAAEARARVEPMFTDATMAGMTEEEFAKYQTRREKVKDVQSETLRDKLIAQLTRQTKAWWKEEKQDIIDEETETLKKQQVYVARERLRAGEPKLDHATVKEMAGEEKTDKRGRTSVIIPPSLVGMTAKGQEGVHPDVAAAFFGYRSGSEMINDLTTAPTLKAQADTNAEAEMVERHGDILTDGTIEKEADEAVQNEERGKLILAELKALSKNTNIPTIDRATIKALAEERIGRLSFREIHPGKYRKAEISAAQEAARMLAEGNREGAAGAKLRQVMNYYLGMAATNAKNDTTKIVDRMARYNKKKVREEIMKAENGYWDQIVKILNRFEFKKSATLKGVESINTWMKERMESAGDGLVLSNAVLNESYVTHWKNVPYSDLQGINDSVKNIEHVARYSNKMTGMQEEIDYNTLKSQWVNHIGEQDARFPTKETRSRIDDARKASTMENVRRWASQLTKIPFMASWLDGGDRVGMSHEILIQPMTDALDAKMVLIDEVATPVNRLIANRSKEDQARHNRNIFIPEIDDNLMGHQILAVALNTGNKSNLKKLLLGEGWADPANEADITIDNPTLQAVLAHMTKSDWELVQKIWDQMEVLYPKLADVHRRTTGLTPPKIDSTPVVTQFGTFNGGYYPVKYSPKRSHKAEKNAEKREAETESMFNNTASIQASVNAGATNERTGFYDRIHLSLDVVPDHFNETIHYITHHDAVRQVNRLIQAPDVANAITGVLGEDEYKLLKPWLNDIAKDGRQQPIKGYIDEAFHRLRFGTTLGVMGFKASTGIMQLFGLLTTAAELGVGPTVKGIQTVVGRSFYMKAVRKLLGSVDDLQSGWEFASERSKVMNHRAQTMDREIKNAMNRLTGKTGALAAVQEVSMKHIALIQTYMVDLPTWHAAYDKHLSENGDEATAVKFADAQVENLQGSGATKDMAAMMRNQSKVHSTFTMFMTFFSSLGNLTRDLGRGARSGQYSATSVAAKTMFLFMLPVFFEMLMRGELDEPDDEDERMSKFLTGVALYPLTSLPFVRDVASGALSDFGYNSSPVASMLERGIASGKSIVENLSTDGEVTKSQLKGVSKLAGAALGVPGMNQIWSTGEHLFDVIEEGEEVTFRELLFGPDRN